MSNLIKQCVSCKVGDATDNGFCENCNKKVMMAQKTESTEQEKDLSGEKTPPPSITVYVEPPATFASGLPAWNLEPPIVAIRRRGRI